MMADYINREEAIKAVGDVHPLDYNGQAILHKIEKIPSADVQPVVYCKDCKWFKIPNNTTHMIKICHKYSGVRSDFDFCSRGERNSDE